MKHGFVSVFNLCFIRGSCLSFVYFVIFVVPNCVYSISSRQRISASANLGLFCSSGDFKRGVSVAGNDPPHVVQQYSHARITVRQRANELQQADLAVRHDRQAPWISDQHFGIRRRTFHALRIVRIDHAKLLGEAVDIDDRARRQTEDRGTRVRSARPS